MKIDKIQALRGPNIWSVQRKKLIQTQTLTFGFLIFIK